MKIREMKVLFSFSFIIFLFFFLFILFVSCWFRFIVVDCSENDIPLKLTGSGLAHINIDKSAKNENKLFPGTQLLCRIERPLFFYFVLLLSFFFCNNMGHLICTQFDSNFMN